MNAMINLLVIEDEQADFLLIERQLRQSGLDFRCSRVTNQLELDAALDVDGWDVVLSDYNVPGMVFWEILELFRTRLPELPLILVSGSVGEEVAVELLKQGVWDFVLKDRLGRLASAIERCLVEVAERRARSEAEQALRASEAKFRSYIEHAPLAVIVMDSGGRCVEANSKAIELTGYDAATLGKMSILDMVIDDGREEAGRSLAKLVRDGNCAVECRIRNKDGGMLWVGLRAVKITDDRFLAFGRDVTQRKKNEERLRLAATVFNSTQEGVAITDPGGNVIAVNPAFTAITEYSEAEVMGRNMRILSSGRHDRDFYQAMWRDILNAGFWQSEIWNRRKSGEIFPLWLTVSAVRNESGEIENYVGVFTDISRIKHSTTLLEHLAHHDPLTDLPNRMLLDSRLEHALDRIQRKGGLCAVLFIDLDRFKDVNDNLGHGAGDDLLQMVAARLRERLRDTDTLARLGGDEFVVVLEELDDADTAATVARDLIDRLRAPFTLAAGQVVEVGCSIGISLCPDHGDDAGTLIKRADEAMYQAKQAGKGTYRFFGE